MATISNLPQFYYTTYEKYCALTEKDSSAIYFMTDTRQIARGDVIYSQEATIVSELPETGIRGYLYFNSTNGIVYIYDGSEFQATGIVTVSDMTDAEDTDVPNVKAVKDYISQELASVYTYKGTVDTVDDLPTEGQKVGDVWHVNSNGDEYAWNGEAWEELGEGLGLESQIADLEESKVDKIEGTAGDVLTLGEDGGIVDSGYTVNSGNGYANGTTPSSTSIITETVLAGVVANIEAGETTELSGKMDIVDTEHAGEVLIAKADGNSEVSGYTIGATTGFAEESNETLLATEQAIIEQFAWKEL